MWPLTLLHLTILVLSSTDVCSAANPRSYQSIANDSNCTSLSISSRQPTHQLSARQLRFPVGAIWHQNLEIPGLFIIGLVSTIATVKILQTLKSVYQTILDALLDAWAKNIDGNLLVVEAGNLRWEFGCTMQPIPQVFLEEYYRSRKNALSRGFLPAYEREWVFNRTDRARYCFAGMRIVEDGEVVVPP
ncbi:MAG: hypothetical protein LQ339_008310 [Xanthoria mediterranea]|nr:MAG: hypothetical protein LQ339_008310 [Xanthoria mediterranea]